MKDISQKKNELFYNNNEMFETNKKMKENYDKSVNTINKNFLNLKSIFQILNESMKNYFLLENEKEFKKQNELVEEKQKKLKEIKEEEINSIISKIKEMINEVKTSGILTNINQIKSYNKNKIKGINISYQNKVRNLDLFYQQKLKNFSIPQFIDEKVMDISNYEEKIKVLINYVIFSYKNILDNLKETLTKEENQSIKNNMDKKKLIHNKYEYLRNLCDSYFDGIKNNWNECCNNIIEKFKIIFYYKQTNEKIEIQIASTFQDSKEKNKKVLSDLFNCIEFEKNNLEETFIKDNTNYNNISTITNTNLTEILNLKKNKDPILKKEKMNSQPKIQSNNFKNYEESGVNYQELYDLKEYNGITCYPVGLQNLGNTCFMNSCIQSIRHCFPFTNFILNEYQPNASSFVGKKKNYFLIKK